MCIKLLLVSLILPTICYGGIKINITAASTRKFTKITFTGADTKVITDRDIEAFNLTIDNINRGMNVELGKIPDNVFMKDPTKYSNLYEKFHWQQVTRKMVVDEAKIIDIINKKVELKTQEFINNTTEPWKLRTEIYGTVENTAFSLWSRDGFPKDDLEYTMNIKFKNPDDDFSYKNNWRNSTTRNKIVNFGLTKPGHIIVKPNQRVKTTLYSLKSILLVEICYTASLTGSFLADYDSLYGKYHFYAPSVKNIMKAADLGNEIKTKEEIEIRFYTEPKLKIHTDSKQSVEIVKPMEPFRILRGLFHTI